MKRRDILRNIGLSSLGMVGLSPEIQAKEFLDAPKPKSGENWNYGRTASEKVRDAKLFAEKFFKPHEMKAITVLVDIIIPADAKSGSASQAGVPAFIEFMAKDQPNFQTPLRGGLLWLDSQSIKRFGKKFVDVTPKNRIEIVDDIAYPTKAKPEFSQGVRFFSLMRDLTASGFWSSKMGIEDMGYKGNVANQWDGPPEEVIKKFGLEDFR